MKNLKFLILLVVMLTIGLITKAQNDIRFPDNHFWYSVSIGKGDATVTNPNAWLEIGKYGTNKGLILPRANVFNIAAAEGNFAYDINTKSLWFHNGTVWTELLTGSEQYDSAYLNAKYFPTTGVLRLYRVDGDSTSLNIAQTLSLSGTSLSISGGNSVSLSTTNVAEGSNLYFTTNRVRQSFTINNGLTFNTSTGLLQFGGSLLQNTNIDLGSFAFNIVSGTNPVFKAANDGTITLGSYGTRNDGGFEDKVLFVDANGVLKYGVTSFLTTEVDPIFTASPAGSITNTHISNWNTAYNDKINSLAFSGTGTKTLTLTQQDGGTLTGTFTDLQGVTSVGLSAPSVFTVTGSPVTSTGTLALSFATGQPANQVLATPNGTTGALGLRTLVAADIPNLDASKITSGIFHPLRLGSGSPSNINYLRGDGIWAVPVNIYNANGTLPAGEVTRTFDINGGNLRFSNAKWIELYGNGGSFTSGFGGATLSIITQTNIDGNWMQASIYADPVNSPFGIRPQVLVGKAYPYIGAPLQPLVYMRSLISSDYQLSVDTIGRVWLPKIKYANNASGDSVLTTDINGQIKQVKLSTVEDDPIFSASPAAGITSGNITNWNAAYNDKVNSIGFTNGTLTLTQQDGGTLTANTFNTTNIPEGSNLYFTNSRVQTFADTRYSLLGHTHTATFTGDVTGTGNITGSIALTIPNSSITYAKIQNVTAGKLLGRGTNTNGIVQEVNLGTGLDLSGGSLSNTATIDNVLSNGNIALNKAMALQDLVGTGDNLYFSAKKVGTPIYTTSIGTDIFGGIATARIGLTNNTNSQTGYLYIVNGETAPSFSNDGINRYTIWHSNNHIAGSAFAPNLTGNNVLASLTTNSSGHVTGATTRTLSATDINAIANQNTVQSGANFNIGGAGVIGGSLNVNGISTLSNVNATGTFNQSGIFNFTATPSGSFTLNLSPSGGVDATGDIYYRSASGALKQLNIGTAGQILTVSAGIPSWKTLSTVTPGGTTGSVQFNSGGSFNGTSDFVVTSLGSGTTLTLGSTNGPLGKLNLGNGGSLSLEGAGSGATTPSLIKSSNALQIIAPTTEISNPLIYGLNTNVGAYLPLVRNSSSGILGTVTTLTPSVLGTGTPTSSTFLRGDGAWVTLPAGGTVTSVGITSTDLSISGSPITTSGNITLNVNNKAITYSKIQDITTNSLIGRYSSTNGTAQEITIGSGLNLNTSTGVLTATTSGGTVTSVGLTSTDITVGGTSPITSSGTYTLTLPNINANVGTFNNVTVNAKGQVTSASNASYAPGNIPLSTVLANGNTANNSITLGSSGNTNAYNYTVIRNNASTNYTTTYGNFKGAAIGSTDGTNSRSFLLSTDKTAPEYSPNGGATVYTIWHENNHPSGTNATTTFTGANVPSVITTNTSGHLTSITTRALTSSDIGAAPASGSANYIQNQTTSAQPGSGFWTAGVGVANRFASVGTVATTTGDLGLYEGTSAAGANQRWRIIRTGTEDSGNTGNDFNIQSLTNTGTLWANPFSINRSTSVVTMPGGVRTPKVSSTTSADLLVNVDAGQAFRFFNGTTENVTISSDGILSIGNNTPSSVRAAPLQVQGNAWATDAWILGTGNTAIAEFGLSGSTNCFVRTMGTGNINFQTSASTVRALINGSTGNFEVNNQIKIAGGSPGAGKLLTSDAAGLATWQAPNFILNGTTAQTANYFITGTGTASQLMADYGSGLGRTRVRMSGSSSGQGFIYNEVNSGSGFATSGTLNIQAGQVNINTGTNISGGLDVAGNITSNGTITAAGGGFNSLRSLKKEINDFSGNALEILQNIKLHNFKYKNNDKDQFIGMVIDENNEVPNELLMNDGKAINTYNTISLLIKAIQELNQKIDKIYNEK